MGIACGRTRGDYPACRQHHPIVLEDVINNSAGYPNTVHFGGSAVLARRGEAPFTPRAVGSIGATPGRNSDDASVAFRRAINAARSGDEIIVPKGSYVFKRPNVVLKSGVGCAARAGR